MGFFSFSLAVASGIIMGVVALVALAIVTNIILDKRDSRRYRANTEED